VCGRRALLGGELLVGQLAALLQALRRKPIATNVASIPGPTALIPAPSHA
jgi:hypothetical protein